VTYIRKARGRPNFAIRDRALVDRVLISGGRATGVVYVDAEGRAHTVEAAHVVVSAGVFGSAPILLRSGVGPAPALHKLGIDVVEDLPVGKCLLDHPFISFGMRTTPAHARMGWPTAAMGARGQGWFGYSEPMDEEEGLSLLVFGLAMHDCPQGTIELASTDPRDPPRIDLNYQEVIEACHFERPWEDFQALLQTSIYQDLGAHDVREGVPLAERLHDSIHGGYQAAGGCCIGRVVAPDLSVYGVEALTVADASAFPLHVSNNPNLTCFAIGEVAAARIASKTQQRSVRSSEMEGVVIGQAG
jgi:choline dehydrogenase